MPSYVHLSQLALSGLTFALSVAVLGTAAHTYSVYRSERFTNPWWLPLWQTHFDTHGVTALISSAVISLVLNSLYLICYFIPKLDLVNRPTFRAVLVLATSLPVALVTLCTVVYAHVLNHNAPDTIQTWTCTYSSAKAVSQDSISGMSNQDYSSLCTESKFALYTTLVVFLLNVLMTGIAVVGWVYDKWNARKTKKEWSESNSMEMPNATS